MKSSKWDSHHCWPSALFFSLSPVRVRDHDPVKDTGWHNSTNQSGHGRTVHKISQRWTTRKLRVQHATSWHCGRTLKKNLSKCHPTCWWTATFPVRFTNKIRLPIRQGIPGNRFSRPSFRWACNPMCRSKLRSEESVFPTLHWEQSFRNRQFVIHLHHNVPPGQVIMNSNPPNYRPKHSCLHDTKFLQAALCQWQVRKSEEHSRRHHCVK